jgi:Tfp pilus assembly protein PilF
MQASPQAGSYMEVAVNKSDFTLVRFFKQSILLLFLVVGALAVGGCAGSDVITYSGESQREGEKLFRQGDYANAAGAFRNCVRQNPRSYKGHYYLACCYTHLDQPQLALAAFRSAKQTINMTLEGQYDKDTHQNILLGMASVIARNDPRNIETDSLQREASSKQDADSWYILAKTYEYRGDADSAIDAYNHAALLEPKNFNFLKEYGLYLVRIGQNQRAESPLRKAYALNSQDQQVAMALRSIGVVPGPSILDEKQLTGPILPKGPIPEMRSTRNDPPAGTTGAGAGNSTVAAPRD